MRITPRLPLRPKFALILLSVLLLGACGSSDDDKDDANIRILNVSTGYQSLDVYTNNDNEDDDDDVQELTAVAINTVSEYIDLDADTYTLRFKRAGAATTLLSLSGQAFTEDSNATYVTFGSTGHFQTHRINDDLTEADTNKTYLSVINAAEAGSLDIYLTEESIPLDDASPQFSTVAAGAGTSAATIDSGSYRLRITGAGDTADLRLDVPSISLSSTQVVSLIVTATQGGVLVNAMLLPQQGTITSYTNTKARVRAAAGMASGTTATLSVDGVTLLSNATAGVIGSRYEQVTAGALPISLGIDGAPVAIPAQTLVSGGDYTLLVWSDSAGVQTTLITDDNHLPTVSGNVKVRILNGMSALAAPITFYVDFAPIAEGVAVGQASVYGDVLSGSEFQFDVTNSLNAAQLYTRSGLSLQAGGVYTMFMTGGTGTVGGTLRRDR